MPAPKPRSLPTTRKPSSYLSELLDLQIGLVTGNNRHFLLNSHLAKSFGLPSGALHPTLSRAKHVKSLFIDAFDVRNLAADGERTLLLLPRTLGRRHGAVRNYLARIPRSERRATVWFNKREPWWKVQTGMSPDAVFTYMNNLGPVLALVEKGVTSSNTLHHARFKRREPEHWKTVVVSMLTTYTQLSAEKVGRVYGGGVLKFELKNARSLELLIPEGPVSEVVWQRIVKAFEAGDRSLAQSLADEAILPEFFGDGWRSEASKMQESIRRHRLKRGVGKVAYLGRNDGESSID